MAGDEKIWARDGAFQLNRARRAREPSDPDRPSFADLAAAFPRPPARRVLWALAGIALFALLVFALLVALSHRLGSTTPLIRAGSIEEIRREGVVYVGRAKAFVVPDGDGFLALSAVDPHLREPIIYCGSSHWFEDTIHGSQYSTHGYYRLGPSPRGMDRYATKVADGVVYLDPSRPTAGPPRGAGRYDGDPQGPFCMAEITTRPGIYDPQAAPRPGAR